MATPYVSAVRSLVRSCSVGRRSGSGSRQASTAFAKAAGTRLWAHTGRPCAGPARSRPDPFCQRTVSGARLHYHGGREGDGQRPCPGLQAGRSPGVAAGAGPLRAARVLHSPRLRALSREDAADISQLTFSLLLEGLDSLAEDSNLGAWLATVTRRHTWGLMEQERSRGRQRKGAEFPDQRRPAIFLQRSPDGDARKHYPGELPGQPEHGRASDREQHALREPAVPGEQHAPDRRQQHRRRQGRPPVRGWHAAVGAVAG